MSAPKVSVVMIAYSAPQFIAEAVESILDQELQGCEVILVDDGSKEDIEGAVAPYRDRVRYIRRENGGPGAARDTGVQASSGTYVAFADSDDIHLPYRMACQAALLDAHPKAALVCSDFSTYEDGEVTAPSTLRLRQLGVDERDLDVALQAAFGASTTAEALALPVPEDLKSSRVYSGMVPLLLAGRHIAWDCASMFRRESLDRVGGHDVSLRYWEDWCHTSRLSKDNEIVYWDAPVHLYRQHGGQITKQSAALGAQSYRDVFFRVWKDDPHLAAADPELLRRMMKRATLRNASYAIEAKEYKRAQTDIVEFIRSAPLDRHGYKALLRNLAHRVMD